MGLGEGREERGKEEREKGKQGGCRKVGREEGRVQREGRKGREEEGGR